MSFSYTIARQETTISIQLEGSLISNHQTENLLADLSFYFEEGANKINIDLLNTEYMNSVGLGVLVKVFTQVRSKGGEVEIINVPEKIKKLLIITKLNSIFNVEEKK